MKQPSGALRAAAPLKTGRGAGCPRPPAASPGFRPAGRGFQLSGAFGATEHATQRRVARGSIPPAGIWT